MPSLLLEEIQTLKAAIRSGAQRVQYRDRTVEYRSLEEMRSILAEMEEEAGLRKGGRKRQNPSYDRGLS
jgi:hypothetical protein